MVKATPPITTMSTNEIYSIVLALITAIATGLVGSFALMKRMTLAGDAMSHIALPGLGIAILLNINPLIGGAAALTLGSLLIWNLEKRTGLSTETMVGVIFSTSLAIGALVTPNEELIEALFGGFSGMSGGVALIYGLLALTVIFALIKLRNQLIISVFSSDLATTSHVRTNRLNLAFLLLFSLTLVLGLRFLGALLVGSLVIIPAAIGRQLSTKFSSFLIISTLASVASVGLGIFLMYQFNLEPDHLGPIVVTVAAALFALSLFKKRK